MNDLCKQLQLTCSAVAISTKWTIAVKLTIKCALPSSSETDSRCNRFSLCCARAAVQPDSSEAAHTGSWKFSYVLLQIIAAQEGS
jgi:hypothetical protein